MKTKETCFSAGHETLKISQNAFSGCKMFNLGEMWKEFDSVRKIQPVEL